METGVWIPCQMELDTSKQKPRWAHIITVDATDELDEDATVALFFRQRDGVVLFAYGRVVRRLRDGSVKIRVPWFVGATLAERAGISVGEVSGRVYIHDCALQYEVIEEAEEAEKESGKGIRVKPVVSEE